MKRRSLRRLDRLDRTLARLPHSVAVVAPHAPPQRRYRRLALLAQRQERLRRLPPRIHVPALQYAQQQREQRLAPVWPLQDQHAGRLQPVVQLLAAQVLLVPLQGAAIALLLPPEAEQSGQ